MKIKSIEMVMKRNSTSSHCRINQKKSKQDKFNNTKNQKS